MSNLQVSSPALLGESTDAAPLLYNTEGQTSSVGVLRDVPEAARHGAPAAGEEGGPRLGVGEALAAVENEAGEDGHGDADRHVSLHAVRGLGGGVAARGGLGAGHS